jgi:hypothetical protein
MTQPVYLLDPSGRPAANTRFGDQISLERLPDIIVSYVYNISSIDVDTTTSGTGATSHVQGQATLTTGASTGATQLQSVNCIRYQPGFEAYAFFTAAFSAGDAGTYQRAGAFDSNNGFFVGQEGTDFKISRRYNGTDYSYTASLPTGFDPTALHAFKISWGWLGILPVTFETWHHGAWVEIGLIDLEGQLLPSTAQPSLPICFDIDRSSGSGACTVATCSWSGGRVGSSGLVLPSDRPWVASNTKTSITTETNVLTLKNAASFLTFDNRVVSQIDFIGITTSGGTKPVTINVTRNATLGGSPSYTDIDASNSVTSYDTAGTTISGGTEEFSFGLGKEDSLNFAAKIYNLILNPSDTLTFSAASANASDVDIRVRLRDLF